MRHSLILYKPSSVINRHLFQHYSIFSVSSITSRNLSWFFVSQSIFSMLCLNYILLDSLFVDIYLNNYQVNPTFSYSLKFKSIVSSSVSRFNPLLRLYNPLLLIFQQLFSKVNWDHLIEKLTVKSSIQCFLNLSFLSKHHQDYSVLFLPFVHIYYIQHHFLHISPYDSKLRWIFCKDFKLFDASFRLLSPPLLILMQL